jgi:hypothetical protein
MGAGESTEPSSTSPAVRVTPGAQGKAPAGPSTVRTAPAPIVSAAWSKREVVPIHNAKYPPATPPTDETYPPDCEVELLVTTKGVADDTPVAISVRRCETKADVPKGAIAGLVVRGNKVVDAETGRPPKFRFSAEQQPYLKKPPPATGWYAPFFYFRVTVSGYSTDSPRDHEEDEEKCLRVKLWVACIFANPDNDLPGTTDHQSAASETNGVEGAQAELSTGSYPSAALFGSLIRNTYAVHYTGHGVCVKQTDPSVSVETVADPTGRVPNPLPNPEEWSGKLYLGPNGTNDYGAFRVAGESTPSVPAALFYGSCCVTGASPSFADAMIAKGCRFVVLFRQVIGIGDANRTAKDFWDEWADEDLDPEKIPDVFYRVMGDHFDKMSPILYPATPKPPEEGLTPGQIAGITVGVILGVGALVGAGVLIWAAATKRI